jgi:hypothetical protein
MASNRKRLVELGMVPPLADELGNQIDGVTPLSARRLMEMTAVAPLAKELVRQMTAGVGDREKLTELGVPGALAAEIAAEIAPSGVPYELPDVFFNTTQIPAALTYTGGVWGHTYDPAAYRVTSGGEYWVETAANGGSDANPGTELSPKLTINGAIAVAATNSKINVGPGRFAPPSFPTAKNLWIKCSTGAAYTDRTFIGTFITNADVSSWGTYTAGSAPYQTITLSSGTISGFLDLAATGTNSAPYNTCRSVANGTTAITTVQALGAGGIFRTTNAVLGATGAGRDLTNTFDTDILAWTTTAPVPYAIANGGQVMIEDGFIVGGGVVSTFGQTTSLIVLHNTSHLGAHTEPFNLCANSIIYGGYFRNCAVGDIMDYSGVACRFVEIGVNAWDGAFAGADNSSTAHGGSIGWRLNGSYGGSARPIHDVGDTMTAVVASTVGAGAFGTTTESIAAGLGGASAGDSTSLHMAQITFTGTPSVADAKEFTNTLSTSRIFVYDDSLAGKTTVGTIVDRSGSKPTADKTFFVANATDLSKLWQTADTSTPVTTDGQAVGRVSINADGAYLLGTTVTYNANSGVPCFTNANTSKLVITNSELFEDDMHLIMTIEATDTQPVLMGQQTSNYFDARQGGGAILRTSYGGTPTYRVNKVAVTGGTAATAATLNPLAFAGGKKTITIKNVSLDWTGWMWAVLGNYGGSLGIDGKIYDIRLVRATNDTNLEAHETASAAVAGLVI